MPHVPDLHLDALRALCARHHVRRLHLFGSAASGTFQPDQSDLDFLVEFLPLSPVAHADAFFGLEADLAGLYPGQPVDLLESSAVRNPFLRQSIDASRRILYSSDDKDAA